MNCTHLIIPTVVLAIAAPVLAQHPGDVFLSIEDGAMATGLVEPGGAVESPVLVFTGALGDSGFPAFTANPGFDCYAGTFDPSTKIGFNVLEPVQVWNGNGFDPAPESMTISFLSLSVTTGPGFTPGFELAVQPNGGFHRHYNMFLNGVEGASPGPGVYLLVRELYSTDPDVLPSEPFYLLLGHEVSTEEIELAEAWLLESLAGSEEEPHFDIWLQADDGQVVTGAIGEGEPGEPLATRWRVFGSELGEDPQFPFSAVEPGLQMLPDESMANAELSFSVGAVEAWTGSGFASTTATMQIAFGPAMVTTGDDIVAGFSFAAEVDGSLHDHFDFTLLGAGESDPEPGVYLLPMTVKGQSPALAASAPFYLVFNLGASEEEHDAAIQWARLNLACGADLDGSGFVDGADLGALLAGWGGDGMAEDLNADGIVDGADLGILLSAWGPCS
ncbi:MAG: hypothetical protein KDA22_07580 [Phycisphaerales bacterium]|nr:hypothetical protein [Phycisphaerales bacterium]